MFVYICQNIDVKSRISDYSLNESPINQHVSSKSAINQQSTTKTPEVSRFFSSQTIQQPVPGWEAVWNSWQIGSCNLTKSILTSIIDNIMIYIYIYWTLLVCLFGWYLINMWISWMKDFNLLTPQQWTFFSAVRNGCNRFICMSLPRREAKCATTLCTATRHD